MAEMTRLKSWQEELASLVEDTGVEYAGDAAAAAASAEVGLKSDGFVDFVDFVAGGDETVEKESVGDQIRGFLMASMEMIGELAKGCRDVVLQSLGHEDSYVVRKFGGHWAKVSKRLRFLNEFLPEDRDPVHAWPVVFFVFVMALAGIPGVKESLLNEFGIRLVTYDLPGFGESDPHPKRNLNSSAQDMLEIADALGVDGKFWVLGYSGGGMHAWAATRYIPERLAGAAMFAPIVNPYDPSMAKEERYTIWEKWTLRRKLLYFLARRFPGLLTYFYRRSFLSGIHGRLDKSLSLILSRKDKTLVEDPIFEEFWRRDVEESIRQGSPKPFIEETVLQVSNWGFSLADIQVHRRRHQGSGILAWIKSAYSPPEKEVQGFTGPIHIWQGMEDLVVAPSTADFICRLVHGATVHKLPDDGHFSYFCFCDECHRQIFSTLFGSPLGPLNAAVEANQDSVEGNLEVASIAVSTVDTR
ncbi:hypothetical protein Scep_015671 [Stephania cephalantha]|uniref:AB hydrolase-1 domain-containing protein n=1 Tax=Stephania cephalantha TaxID=152367 RepID=A0AAP0J516_9MAGN